MTTTQREQWWDSLTAAQRAHLLTTAGASEAQITAFQTRNWYQLNKWIRKSIGSLKPYQMAVPV